MKKRFVLIASIVATIIALTVAFTSCTNKKYDTTQKTGEVEKTSSLTVKSDGSFKILQLTDLHLTSGGTYKQDNETLRWLEEVLDSVKPDLVELTGDIVGGGVKGRNAGLLAVANIFEKREIYWAYTFGNHDGEHSSKENGSDWWIGKEGKQTNLTEACERAATTLNTDEYTAFYGDNTKGNLELYELLKGYKYSLLTRSEEEKANDKASSHMGVGNYVIDLKDSEGNVKFALFHMDTHGKFYLNPKGNSNPDMYLDAGYVGLTDMQVEWYEDKVAEYSENNIGSAIFMHVPNYGYRLAYETFTGLNQYGVPQYTEKTAIAHWSEMESIPDDLAGMYVAYRPVKYNKIAFEKNEGIYAPRWDDGLMDSIYFNPSTVLISVGHDHNNSFISAVDIDDDQSVLLAYGRTSGVNAWARDIPIGASVYTINTKGATTTEMVSAEIVYPSFKYTKLGNR